MKTARRRSREAALQALYAWLLAGGDSDEYVAQAGTLEGYSRADRALAENLIRGVIARAPQLEELIAARIDRRLSLVSPVERAILMIGVYELSEHAATPFKVVINEAIELGKSFGGSDGHKFVNGVLEKLAATLRPDEVARGGRSHGLEIAGKPV